ncbi:hypothetical protein [Spirosoma montaniterrae]|uniref:hypothetical protein n=1 Tax=Spirosoma montaniterrae TaxID=1178516 RepID=UPI0012F7A290|nr:hypothetical protein [Spirosoma montaniterrae]
MKVISLFFMLLALVYVTVRHQQQVLARPAEPIRTQVAAPVLPINYPLVCSLQ